MGTRPDREYFPLLDGVRGLAAIAVMFRHLSLFGVHSIAQSYLGVDVFFALSGAVVASAYERKLRGGMTTGEFMRRRFVRLYPMIVIGVALGIVNAVWGEPEGPVKTHLGLWAALALLLAGDNPLVPMITFNRPSWTMAFEFAINFLYARMLPWLSVRVLVGICGACAMTLAYASWREHGLDTGDSYRTLAFGAARTGFAFFLGVGLYRLHRSARWPLPKALQGGLGATMCAVLLAACLFAPPLGHRWIVAYLSVLFVVPAIVWLGLGSKVGGATSSWCLRLGALSYPLYLIHDPLGQLAASLLIRSGAHNLHLMGVTVFAPVCVLLALAAHYWIDEPLRAWIETAIKRRQSVPAVAPAE